MTPVGSPMGVLREAIESTALGFDVSGRDVEGLCREAVEHGLGGVCVGPAWVEGAARILHGTGPRLVTVANFPFGHGLPEALEAEARAARNAGADEVDVVFPLHCVASRDWSRASETLDALEEGLEGLPWKLILETAAWGDEELDDLLGFVRDRGVPRVKTSTGLHPAGGATLEAVRTLRRSLPGEVGIKASGGIRSREFALELMDAGADRLGTSSALDLLERD